MEFRSLGWSRPLVAAGGAALVASTFLPWVDQGGEASSAWDAEPGLALLVIGTGIVALIAAATDGRLGLFRPDVSIVGAADLFSVAATLVVATFVLAGLPSGADAGAGAFIAIGAAAVTACACADWRPLRGAPLFPRSPVGRAD